VDRDAEQPNDDDAGSVRPSMSRRRFLQALGAGTTVIALGGARYALADDGAQRAAQAQTRADGRSRLPPSQHLIERIRPMGGREGHATPGDFQLRVVGEVEQPFVISYAELLHMPQVEQTCDVHCVTKWSVFDSHWTGVRVADLIARAKPKASAHYVIFEAAEGYTSNVRLQEALQPNVLVAHRYEGQPLAREHGAPVRAVVPDLYFWKSAKWLTGIRLTAFNERGYWESRGYHNHADPWKEERVGGG
jgi:DMSO/TMAO reductase YedYZ molybdopterin-dependent catalytic subunit